MLPHRLEVAVVVQEHVAVTEAEGRDDHVDRLARRDAALRGRSFCALRRAISWPERKAAEPGATEVGLHGGVTERAPRISGLVRAERVADDGRCLCQTQAEFRPGCPGRRDPARCIGAPVFAFPQVIA
jgi:hypothetical protein